jgi:hypothetical protein
MKKRPLTLLEVIIALSLTGVLLSVLFGFYKHLSFSNVSITAAKQTVLYREWTQEKLAQVFSAALPKEGFCTVSLEKSIGKALSFHYDNGPDPDPNYCHVVRGALHLNSKNELCLITWPGRKQVLYAGVKAIHFSFFDGEELSWKDAWSEEDRLPEMLKLTVYEDKHRDQPIEFAYFLPIPNQQIKYAPKKVDP